MARGLADLVRLDATFQLQALASRRITALELLEASVVRNADLANDLNAVVAKDLEAARDRARAIDDRRDKGETVETLGALAGLPMTVKDTIDVHGMPASSGVKAYLGRNPADSPVIAKIRHAGAVIWGKTNTPVMAADWQTYNPLYGVTNNPWDVTRTPGGSSGGAAAALAAGITPLEIGSDIGGSLRIPASFCGIYAHKPTFGLVPTLGHVPPEPGALAETDMNVIGPMARSARDLRLLLALMTEAPIPPRAPPANLSDLKIGLWLDEPHFPVDPVVRTAIERFCADLTAAGAVIEPIDSPVDAETLLEIAMVLLLSIGGPPGGAAGRFMTEAKRWPAKLSRALGAGPLSPAFQTLAMTARHSDWLEANEARAEMLLVLKAVFEAYPVIIAPAAPVAAFPHDNRRSMGSRVLRTSDGGKLPYDSLWCWIALASVCGLPATAVPAGTTPEGLPVGIQLIGARGADSRLLAVAQAMEAALGGFVPPALD